MRKRYYNFDYSKPPVTEKQVQQELINQRLATFHVEGDHFYDTGEPIIPENSPMNKVYEDALQASSLIFKGLELPQELEDRLYIYNKNSLLS